MVVQYMCKIWSGSDRRWRLQAGEKFRQMHALRAFFPFFSRDRALVKPVGRFWRVIRQNACFGPSRCPFGSRKINISVFTPQNRQNPNFWALSMHFLWKTKRVNNFWTVSPIIAKFDMQSLMRTSKSALYSKIKKIEIQDGRRHHYFLCSSGLRLGQTSGLILTSDTSKRVFWPKEVLFGV